MRLNNLLSRLFLTEAELITEKKYVRWKRVSFTALGIAIAFMLSKAFFGSSSAQADNSKYKTVSTDQVRKEGEVILHAGPYEIRKSGQRSESPGRAVAAADSNDTAQVISRKDRAHSEYVLPAGTKITVSLEGDLNSQLSQSPVVAHINEGFSFKGRTLIPAGSKVLGRVGEASDSGRIGVRFDQLVYPNGYQVAGQSLAMMPDGSPGIIGDYHSGAWGKFAGSVGLSFVSGAAAALESTQANAFGFDQPEASTKNAILNGLARSTLDQGKLLGENAQNSPGYVTVSSGTEFQIYFENELDLTGVMQ